VLSRIGELRKQLDPLEKELREIQVAKRALGMPGAGAAPIAGPAGASFMTIKQLVIHALKDRFKDGATGKQLVDFFKTAWGREIARESLSPQLSRLRVEKKIDRRGRIWFLTGDKT
jgi:hypothetical protein